MHDGLTWLADGVAVHADRAEVGRLLPEFLDRGQRGELVHELRSDAGLLRVWVRVPVFQFDPRGKDADLRHEEPSRQEFWNLDCLDERGCRWCRRLHRLDVGAQSKEEKPCAEVKIDARAGHAQEQIIANSLHYHSSGVSSSHCTH